MTEREADKGLVEEAAGGNAEAFTLLVWRWQRPLYNFLLRLTGDREQARDISQETFLRAYTRLKDLREKEKFASWLFRIAVNLHWSQVRARQPGSECEPDGVESSEAPAEARERQLTVRELIVRLPAKQREVLLLKVYHGFRFDEIASILDCPESTVKSRLYKAFELIRAGWESQGPPANS
ncbi:MAG TPA: sigma-70 family RNA polymerase sigma factor [Candidatus Acidoferrales bacterium]|nr:sigma-70 family RNA polymerase sigma factor [Candidatus Acidoferrales bacterium]